MRSRSTNDDQQQLNKLFEELTNGNMNALKPYYLGYKEDFFNFAARYTTDREMRLDAYHDAFLIFYENIVGRKLTEMKSSLKTYVFSIAKYHLLTALRKRGTEVSQLENFGELKELAEMKFTETADEEHISALRNAFARLGSSCRQLLTLFYYRKYTIDAIRHHMDYKNDNTVKAHKSRCIKQLRTLMQSVSR